MFGSWSMTDHPAKDPVTLNWEGPYLNEGGKPTLQRPNGQEGHLHCISDCGVPCSPFGAVDNGQWEGVKCAEVVGVVVRHRLLYLWRRYMIFIILVQRIPKPLGKLVLQGDLSLDPQVH